MAPIFTGSRFGFGRSADAPSGPPNGYEILLEYINTSYDSNATGSFTLPADYNQPGSAIIIYGVAGGGSAWSGAGDDGYGGGGGGAGSVSPGGYLITSGVAGGVTISYQVGRGSKVATPGLNPSPSTPGGNTTVSVGASPVLTLNGGAGSVGTGPNSGSSGGGPGGTASGSGTGTLTSGGRGGQGANRPGSQDSTEGSSSNAGAGGGGAGGHLSSYPAGKKGGPQPESWATSTLPSGNLSGTRAYDSSSKIPFIVSLVPIGGGLNIPAGAGAQTSIDNNVGLARAGTGWQDNNSGGAGGAGGGVKFTITEGGSPRNMKNPDYLGPTGVPNSLAIAGGGGGANVSVGDGIRYPNGTKYQPFNFRTGANPGPVNPYQVDGFGNGGGGCLLIIGRVGPA